MARSVATIQAQLISFFAANNNLTYQDEQNITRNITYNTSKRAFWKLITFVVAACIGILEQLFDLFTAEVQAQVAQSAAVSVLWIQEKMFLFQFDETHHQLLQLNAELVPAYPVVNPTMQIISACSVTVDESETVNIKVATGDPLQIPWFDIQVTYGGSKVTATCDTLKSCEFLDDPLSVGQGDTKIIVDVPLKIALIEHTY